MKSLVTGASGFVGSNLVKELINKGHEVLAVTREKENNLSNLNVKIIETPFYELNWDEVGNIDTLFHEAAITDTTVTDEKEMSFVNTTAPIRLFKEAIAHGCKHIAYASSTGVYGNSPAPSIVGQGEEPLNEYGKSKLALDKEAMSLAKQHPEVIIVGLRYCNVFGPGESHKGKNANMVYQFAQQILQGRPKLFKHGEQKRDQIYVKDVALANLQSLNAKESCILNCGAGKPVTFNEMIKVLNEVLKTDKQPTYIDNPYPFFQTHTECDMTLTKEKIGFTTTYSFKEGVEDYFKSGKLTES
tara:strand:- start:114 stop:1016 length:903 start_codon:yes stop_codon:yes gene_type:complete